MNISVIIPNLNGENLLRSNLKKIIKILSLYRDGKKEVIVVDDKSSDNSLGYIKEEILNNRGNEVLIKLIENEKNFGFSKSVNRGVDEARGDIIILLNTDVLPENNFLNQLLEHFKDDKIFAVGCLDKSIESGQTILRGRGVGKWARGFLVHRRGEVNKTDTLWVSGGSGAFKKSIWDKLGGLNEIYSPFYWEDIDLSYRALKSGYKILFEPESIVVHEHESGAIRKNFSQFKIKTIAYRNQFIFVWTDITDSDFILLHLLWIPYHFAKSVLNLDLPFILGFLNALVLVPKIIQSRAVYKKQFIKKDQEILVK